jgi:peptide/nickel transport system permease protein
MRTLATWVLAMLAFGALTAPWISPQDPHVQFTDRTYAPPARVHVRHGDTWRAPFVYRQVLVDRVSRQFVEDTSTPVPLRWLRAGKLVTVDPERGPLLWLGADGLGRDVWSRLWHGARLSLGVAIAGALGALLIGTLLGALAGAKRGFVDTGITGVADFVVVLPSVYLVLVLRAALPLVLDTPVVFLLMTVLFAIAGWPHVARGVRAIVATERQRDYAEAARAAGAGPLRLLGHLVPAAYGFLRTELVLLIPALLVAESTISFLGLGFPEPVPSWGLMLQDASSVSAMQLAPWMLSPALLLFVGVFALQQVAGGPAVDTAVSRR